MKRLMLACLWVWAGCGGSEQPVRLDGPVKLVATMGAGAIQAQVTGATVIPSGPAPVLYIGETMTAPPTGWANLTVDGLALGLRTTNGRAWLDEVRLPMEDVKVYAPGLPEAGLQIRNLALRIQGPARMDIVRGHETALALAGELGVTLEWQLQLDDGTLYPLGGVPLGPMEINVGAARNGDGTLRLALMALCAAPCGGIEGLFSIGDVMLMVNGPVAAAGE